MCGRFVAASPPAEVADYFRVDEVAETLSGPAASEPNFNVAPSSDILVVYTDAAIRRLDPLRWGLIPSWAKDMSVGNRMINARAETIATKSAFRTSFAKRRCIIPADGFYEWKKIPGSRAKQPYYIHRPDGEPYAFGGVWSQWSGQDKSGQPVTVRSATIITCPPNSAMAELHDRMPVILPPGAWDDWLDPTQQDPLAMERLLVPAPPELIRFHPVSTDVNNVRNKGAELIVRIDPAGTGELS